MEVHVPKHSGMVVVAEQSGTVSYCDAMRILVDEKEYRLRKFVGLNERTCLNQQPCVVEGQKSRRAKSSRTAAERFRANSPRKNVLVAFMSWEDTTSRTDHRVGRLLRRDTYTSIHIEEFEIEIRETKLGREEFTRTSRTSPRRRWRNLDETGVIRIARASSPATCSSARSRRSPRASFPPREAAPRDLRTGREDVKNDSLEVPPASRALIAVTLPRVNVHVDDGSLDARRHLEGVVLHVLAGPSEIAWSSSPRGKARS